MINSNTRYQTGLTMNYLYPSIKDTCACGCSNPLSKRRKKWYSDECRTKALYEFYIIKGDISVIRDTLFKLEEGFCRSCGAYDDNWEADHIIPVHKGGGGCTIDNFQTLCFSCHKEKTLTLNGVPNGDNIFTTSLNHLPPLRNTCGTSNKTITEHIV